MSLLACIGLFAAVLVSLLGPGWLAGINEVPTRPFIAGSALSGLLWTLTIGLGTFFVGPSLIHPYGDAGKWTSIAALTAGAAVATVILLHPKYSGRSRLRPIPGR